MVTGSRTVAEELSNTLKVVKVTPSSTPFACKSAWCRTAILSLPLIRILAYVHVYDLYVQIYTCIEGAKFQWKSFLRAHFTSKPSLSCRLCIWTALSSVWQCAMMPFEVKNLQKFKYKKYKEIGKSRSIFPGNIWSYVIMYLKLANKNCKK